MPKPPEHPAGLLRAALADDPARPLVTFYDDASGERIELSVKTFGNWVAKTANLLVDGLCADPGERVALALPAHWQSAVWLFACWSAGMEAAPVTAPETTGETAGTAPDPGPDVLVAAETGLTAAMDRFPGAREVVGLSLHPLGGPLTDPPPGVLDYATDVRAYADRFEPVTEIAPDAPALLPAGADGPLSGAELMAAATRAARDWGLGEKSRVLSTVGFVTLSGLLAGMLAPLTVSGSVVICRNVDESGLDHRLAMEHVTAVAGVAGRDSTSWSRRGLISLPS